MSRKYSVSKKKVVYFYKKILEFLSLTKSINKRFWKEDKTLVIQTYTVLMKKKYLSTHFYHESDCKFVT